MTAKTKKQPYILIILWLLLGACLFGLAGSSFSNLFLPQASRGQERLSAEQQALMAEAQHLRASLGGKVWPGWDAAPIPLIAFNESRVFLTGAAEPPADGWVSVPREQQRGGAWSRVDEDTAALGQPYYRQTLPDPQTTPQNFTVKVGEAWAASLMTKEASDISLVDEFRQQMPPVLQTVIPFGLAIRLFNSDWYISALLHESFHAYQGQRAPQRLYAAEFALLNHENAYPFEDEAAWQAELQALQDALRAKTDEEAAQHAQTFLALRAQRRAALRLTAEQIDLERQREWLEGGAKYTELAIWQAAARDEQYAPLAATSLLRDFQQYRGFNGRWQNEVSQITRSAGSETLFYYSGMAQAFLLDRLAPNWKQSYFLPDVWLEDLLAAALE
ncbi:MAG: hypothetical protein GYA48_14990 [Chloroflexi bacterium]|nr:hypothetical protein [Chloroflexota bacterium]